MEKSHSRPLTKRSVPVGDESFNINVVVRQRRTSSASSTSSVEREKLPDKPSREDISRCINIWASMYLADDEILDKRELTQPSRPWLGRNPSSLKRFE
ncbi:MAG TPA: hypothetical protein VEC35_20740 [Noviherbaspirillum sp.]|nr:hypothetical protein [Noviherbaspirillum sp.]